MTQRVEQFSSQSTEFVKVDVARDSGVDPTGDVVAMAFVADGVQPVPGDFKAGSWETIDGIYKARCLIGPAGVVQLVAGTYVVWVKITDNPEVPVKRSGYIKVI
jgi:hypothetical protein